MIAAGTLWFLDPFDTGQLVLFQVTYDKVSQSLHSTSLLPDDLLLVCFRTSPSPSSRRL